MENSTNSLLLRGYVGTRPEFSHENHGKRFFRFLLEVPRLSGTVDRLPVVVREELLTGLALEEAPCLTLRGQIRSHNHYLEGKRHLLIFAYGEELSFEPGEPVNEVHLEGILCREPTYRRTPLGREICDTMLAVPRAFQRTDYLPCILWGRMAQEAARCHTRDRIILSGRLQSRLYTKLTDSGAQERTAYEISALTARFQQN